MSPRCTGTHWMHPKRLQLSSVLRALGAGTCRAGLPAVALCKRWGWANLSHPYSGCVQRQHAAHTWGLALKLYLGPAGGGAGSHYPLFYLSRPLAGGCWRAWKHMLLRDPPGWPKSKSTCSVTHAQCWQNQSCCWPCCIPWNIITPCSFGGCELSHVASFLVHADLLLHDAPRMVSSSVLLIMLMFAVRWARSLAPVSL